MKAKSPWKPSKYRKGKRYAIFWVWETKRCGDCGEIRYTWKYLRLLVAMRSKENHKKWIVRSRRIKPKTTRRASDMSFFSAKRRSSYGYIRAEELNGEPDIRCKCLRLRLPSGLNLKVRLN